MAKYIAFLRGINVGGHNIIKMDVLKALFEDLGFEKVETFIASGNVVFESPLGDTVAVEELIENHLEDTLGTKIATFVRTPAQLSEMMEKPPFNPLEGHSMYVAFAKTKPTPAVTSSVQALANKVDLLAVSHGDVFWLRKGNSAQSKVTGPRIEKALGGPSTTRNVTTINSLVLKHNK